MESDEGELCIHLKVQQSEKIVVGSSCLDKTREIIATVGSCGDNTETR